MCIGHRGTSNRAAAWLSAHAQLRSSALIGPRPQPPEFTSLNEWRPDWVRPGMLAVAAADGRRALTIDDRLAIDRQYLLEASLKTDLLIVLRTAVALVRGTR